jgi:hypothetical protein
MIYPPFKGGMWKEKRDIEPRRTQCGIAATKNISLTEPTENAEKNR